MDTTKGNFSRQTSRLADGRAGTQIDVYLERCLAAIQEGLMRRVTQARGIGVEWRGCYTPACVYTL